MKNLLGSFGAPGTLSGQPTPVIRGMERAELPIRLALASGAEDPSKAARTSGGTALHGLTRNWR